MAITFLQARTLLAPFAAVAGRCPNSDEMELFVRKVLQYMLISGAHGDLRKFCFCAVNGFITLPPELETPLKVKIDGEIGSSWSKWFEYHNYGDEVGCIPAANALIEEPDYFSTIYDITPGYKVATQSVVEEAADAHIIVTGTDITGREIVTRHQGKEIVGEYISVMKGRFMSSQVSFGRISGVTKSRTKGYVGLYGYDPSLNRRQFLADYSSFEQVPRYRRFKLTTRCPGIAKITVIGRIRLREYYADSDILPFENLFALELAAQSMQASRNNDTQTAAAKDQAMGTMIQRENQSKQVNNGAPIEVYYPLSFGSLKGLL